MKTHLTQRLIALGFLLSSSLPVFANEAGLFVEPMLTYERGDAEFNLPAPFGSSESSVNGFGLGARLGLHVYDSVFFALDARYSQPTYKNDDTGVDRRANSYNYGPLVGVQMPTPFGLRMWGSYIAGGELDVEKEGEVDFDFKKARGYRVGAGVKLTLVSLNLEYQEIKYRQTYLSDASIFTGTAHNVDQKNKSFVFSVSFPITL